MCNTQLEAAHLQVCLTLNVLCSLHRFFYASSACIYPEGKQLDTEVEGGGLKEKDAWPAQGAQRAACLTCLTCISFSGSYRCNVLKLESSLFAVVGPGSCACTF